MTKQDLIYRTAQRTGITTVQAGCAVEAVMDSIRESLKKGEPVQIRGFGTFRATRTKPSTRHNPRTMEPIKVPSRLLPKFKAGRILQEIVNAAPANEA